MAAIIRESVEIAANVVGKRCLGKMVGVGVGVGGSGILGVAIMGFGEELKFSNWER